jgi:hypothetical protein
MVMADTVASLTSWFKRAIEGLKNVARCHLPTSNDFVSLAQSCGALSRCTVYALFVAMQACLDESIWIAPGTNTDRVCSPVHKDFVSKSKPLNPEGIPCVYQFDAPRRKVADPNDSGLVSDLRFVQTRAWSGIISLSIERNRIDTVFGLRATTAKNVVQW